MNSSPAFATPQAYRTAFLSVSIALLFVLGGCSSTSLVGSRYDDFTAYYNTFYNAERSFKRGEAATKPRPGAIDRQIFQPVFPLYDSPSTSKDFEEAIRKSADVLRDHGSSKWVDDALLLIGKSYFYQQNYFAADEKFREVMELETKREGEARYWLARTQLASRSYPELREHLLLTFEGEKESRKWTPLMQLINAELLVREGEMEDAVGQLAQGARAVKDRAIRARANYLLGQIHESLGNYADAIDAYKRAQKKNSNFDLVYAARISVIRATAEAGDTELALRDLRKMERDDKNFDQIADLRALRAEILQQVGAVDEAVNAYDAVLRGNDRISADVKGAVHYQLAKIYRDVDQDYTRAAAHFDTAAIAIQSQIDKRRLDGQKFGFADPFVPWAIVDAREQKEIFGTFADVQSEVAEMDSLLYLGSLDDEAFEVRIEEIRRQRRAELAAEARLQQQRQIEEQFRTGATASANTASSGSRVKDIGQGVPSSAAAAASATSESGFLYHKDPARVQEGFRNFVAIWGERAPVPGWRLSSKLLAASAAQEGATPDKRLASAKQAASRLLGTDNFGAEFDDINVDNVPRTEERLKQMRTDRAEARYRLGTVLFLSIDRPDSAATWFRQIITDDPDQPIAPKAYYALAEVNRALGDSGRADELMARMNEEFPEYGAADVEEIEAERAAVRRHRAEAAYAALYEDWQNALYPDAAAGLIALAASAEPTDVAPQALYAAGSVLIDWARTDDRSFLAPVGLALPDSVALWLGVEPSQQDATSAAENVGASVAGADSVGANRGGVAPGDVALGDAAHDDAAHDDAAHEGARNVDAGNAAATVYAANDIVGADSVQTNSEGLADGAIDYASGRADSLVVAADSLLKPLGGLSADSTRRTMVVGPGGAFDVSIENVLTLLTSRFTGTEYAKLAQKQLETIEEIRSVEQARRDSLAAIETARADSIAASLALLTDSLSIGASITDSLLTDSTVFMPSEEMLLQSDVADSTQAGSVDTGQSVSDSLVSDGDRTAADSATEVDTSVSDAPLIPDGPIYGVEKLTTAPTVIGGIEPISAQVVAPEGVSPVGFMDIELIVTSAGAPADIFVVFSVLAEQGAAAGSSLNARVKEAIHKSAIEAVSRAKFEPGQLDGVAVNSRIKLKVQLSGN